MRRLYRWLIPLVSATFIAPTAGAIDGEETAKAWLSKMTQAVANLSYEGTFVYLHDGQMEAMRIYHKAGNGGVRERLLSLNGAAREIVRDDDLVICYLPDTRSVVVERRLPQQLFPTAAHTDLDRVTEHYDMMLVGRDRMAGFDSRVIAIQPRDDFRYGFRMWIAAKNGMLLKSDLLDGDGESVEQLMFTDLTVHDRLDEGRLEPTTSPKGFTWFMLDEYGDAGSMRPDGKWTVSELPPGFNLVSHKRYRMSAADGPVEHMVFSDGLATVSVYIEVGDAAGYAAQGASRMGAVNAYGSEDGQNRITVVGEVPEATVRMIGEAVERVE